jgi:plastocyanin
MRRLVLMNALLVAFTLAACDGEDQPSEPDEPAAGGAPANIAVSSGDNQRIIVGGQLLAPLQARVTNAQGGGVSGVTVNWEVTQGGGQLSATSSTTNSSGQASVAFTAGPSAEANTITASVAGVSGAATFNAMAVEPSSITAAGGDNQEVRAGVSLANQLESRVTASDNGPVPGATVQFEVTAGDGVLTAASATTDVDGRTSVGLTAGSSVGAITVNASPAGSSASTTFNIDVSAPVSVTVTMENIAFNAPGGGDDITIMLGDTVRWVNNDAVQHTATSTQTPAGGTDFESGFLNQNQEFEVVPNARGIWIYFCRVHPTQMADARITVN